MVLHRALSIHSVPKSSMSNSKKVREGKSTKGALAKGHICAYPTHARRATRSRSDARRPLRLHFLRRQSIQVPKNKHTNIQIYIMIIISVCNHTNNTGIDMLSFFDPGVCGHQEKDDINVQMY